MVVGAAAVVHTVFSPGAGKGAQIHQTRGAGPQHHAPAVGRLGVSVVGKARGRMGLGPLDSKLELRDYRPNQDGTADSIRTPPPHLGRPPPRRRAEALGPEGRRPSPTAPGPRAP